MTRARPRKRAKRARGALMLIGGLLIVSAVMRIGNDVGQAWARGTPDEGEPTETRRAVACTSDADLQAMLHDFQEREAQLQRREAAMAERQRSLTQADLEIEAKLASLKEAEQALRQTMMMADTAADSDIDRLTKVYENMKPKQAAQLFEEMSPEFAAGFLGRMRPEAAAGIMAGLSPQAAHTFSVVLAGRNAGAPVN